MKSVVFNERYEDVMPRYPNGYFDIAVCDIPYGINVGNMAFLKEKKHKVKQKNGNELSANYKKNYKLKDWDLITPPQEYFDELRRISKHQIIFGVEYVNWTGLGPGRIKWVKGVHEEMSFKGYEVAYCSLIDQEVELPLLWNGMMQAKSLSEPMVQQGNKKLNEKRIHPCHKPVMLYDKLFLDYGFKGMKVFDSHVGSQSSRISADKFDAEYVGCEVDIDYFNDGEKRFKEYKSKINLIFPE